MKKNKKTWDFGARQVLTCRLETCGACPVLGLRHVAWSTARPQEALEPRVCKHATKACVEPSPRLLVRAASLKSHTAGDRERTRPCGRSRAVVDFWLLLFTHRKLTDRSCASSVHVLGNSLIYNARRQWQHDLRHVDLITGTRSIRCRIEAMVEASSCSSGARRQIDAVSGVPA